MEKAAVSQINGHEVKSRAVTVIDETSAVEDYNVTELGCLICGEKCFTGVLDAHVNCAVACAFCWNKISLHRKIEEPKA